MISFLRGSIAAMTSEYAVVDVGGVGFQVYMPVSSLERLPANGEEVTVSTFMQVREDAMQLFGFLSRDDVDMFQMLIKVSGIGPKGAVSIMSTLPGNDLRFAILSGDAASIAKSPGIGKKTAEKMILELKDKLDLADTLPEYYDPVPSAAGDIRRTEAVEALVALGYSGAESLKAVRRIVLTDDMTVEDIIKIALMEVI